MSSANERRFEYTEKALNHNKDVYVEKPLALQLDQAQKLNDLAKSPLLRVNPADVSNDSARAS